MVFFSYATLGFQETFATDLSGTSETTDRSHGKFARYLKYEYGLILKTRC